MLYKNHHHPPTFVFELFHCHSIIAHIAQSNITTTTSTAAILVFFSTLPPLPNWIPQWFREEKISELSLTRYSWRVFPPLLKLFSPTPYTSYTTHSSRVVRMSPKYLKCCKLLAKRQTGWLNGWMDGWEEFLQPVAAEGGGGGNRPTYTKPDGRWRITLVNCYKKKKSPPLKKSPSSSEPSLPSTVSRPPGRSKLNMALTGLPNKLI